MRQANRLGWIDYARGIAIIIVVYRHAYEGIAHMSIGTDLPYWSYILQESVYNLCRPIFFIVAGSFLYAAAFTNAAWACLFATNVKPYSTPTLSELPFRSVCK